jgi:hypothetical protein
LRLSLPTETTLNLAPLTNTYRDQGGPGRGGLQVFLVRDAANEGTLLQDIGDHVQRLVEAGPEAVGFSYYSGYGPADRPDGAVCP